jgi:hypothetical protein
MASVFAKPILRSTTLLHRITVQVLPADVSADNNEFRARFNREADLAAERFMRTSSGCMTGANMRARIGAGHNGRWSRVRRVGDLRAGDLVRRAARARCLRRRMAGARHRADHSGAG